MMQSPFFEIVFRVFHFLKNARVWNIHVSSLGLKSWLISAVFIYKRQNSWSLCCFESFTSGLIKMESHKKNKTTCNDVAKQRQLRLAFFICLYMRLSPTQDSFLVEKYRP